MEVIELKLLYLKLKQDSLERSMLYFADVEQYDLAARSRDCIENWKNK